MANTKKIKRPGSGRTKGSFSFVKISMADLIAKFADPKQTVVLSRKWAESCGFENLTSSAATNILASIQGETPTSKAAVVEVDLND